MLSSPNAGSLIHWSLFALSKNSASFEACHGHVPRGLRVFLMGRENILLDGKCRLAEPKMYNFLSLSMRSQNELVDL
jgi:hypothetical protein